MTPNVVEADLERIMWTPATPRWHSRDHLCYGSDLSDEEWKIIAPFMPKPAKMGRPHQWSMREIMHAIFYVLRGGVAWRLLPKDFPPMTTVYGWFLRFRREACSKTINHCLVMADRDGAVPLLKASRKSFAFVDVAFADSACSALRVRQATRITIEVVRKIADQIGFQVLPRRWVVERTFAWINRNRRLAKDFEGTIASAEAFLYAASVMLLTRRLARSE